METDTCIKFKEGTRLRYPILDLDGVMLLNSGAILNQNLVDLLYRRGIRLKLNASLEVIEGESVGTEIAITDKQIFIGRRKNCRIRPNDRSVSGNHCVIKKLPLSLQVRDLKSTNGTKVNGIRIDEPTELNDEDIIGFGAFAIRVHLYAALESNGGEARDVAQLILADKDEFNDDLDEGVTMEASAGMAKKIRMALQAEGLV